MHARARRATGALLFAAVAVLALWLLYLFSTALVTRELQREAAADLAAWSNGATPWTWHLLRPRDVVAGHAFGQAGLVAGNDGLRARGTDGSAYEIGLPLARDADLRRAPRLRATLATARPLRLWLVVRERLDAPLCMAAAPWSRTGAATWELDALHWARPGGTSCQAPRRAALLRLRVRQPAGSTLRFGTIALLPRPGLSVGDTVALPAAPDAAARSMTEAAASWPDDVVPRVRLPAQGSPQRLLALRDRIHALWPAAIVLPASPQTGSIPAPPSATKTTAATSASRPWIILGMYALALCCLAWWPPRGRWRPWLQAAGCVAGPLWLIAGLHLGLHTAPVHIAAFGLALVYAAWIEFRERPADWRWGGGWRHWLAALVPVPVAVALVCAFSQGGHAPPVGRVAVYLAWAALQQWLMLAVVLRRLSAALPGTPAVAVLACATVFALLHTPNAQLMLACFAVELWWGWCFLRGRALLPVAVAHAACALVLQAGLAGGWLRSLEVGARYFLAP